MEKTYQQTKKEAIGDAIVFLDLRCDCNNMFFAIADDYTIVCKNCKKRFELKLSEIKLGNNIYLKYSGYLKIKKKLKKPLIYLD